MFNVGGLCQDALPWKSRRRNLLAMPCGKIDWLGCGENISQFRLQIVPARSGVDRSLKRLRALAEPQPPAPHWKSGFYRLLAARSEQQVEAGRERQH